MLAATFVTSNLVSASEKIASKSFDPELFPGCVWDGEHDVSPCIQAAVSAAAAEPGGGTVRLPSGTWPLERPVTLTSKVSLIGNHGQATLTPTSSNSSDPLLLTSKTQSNDIVVQGIRFTENEHRAFTKLPAIKITDVDKIIFNDITVVGFSGISVGIQGGSSHSGVVNSKFVNDGNVWKKTLQRSDRVQGLVFCCGPVGTGNFAIGNYFEDIGLDALQISDQDHFVAAGNKFNLSNEQTERLESPDYGAGIFTTTSTNVLIYGNQIRGTQGNGIDAPGLRKSIISVNSITDSGCAGIGLFRAYDKKTDTTSITISKNQIKNNGRWTRCMFRGGIAISGGLPTDIYISENFIGNATLNGTQVYGVQTSSAETSASFHLGPGNRFSYNKNAALGTAPLGAGDTK